MNKYFLFTTATAVLLGASEPAMAGGIDVKRYELIAEQSDELELSRSDLSSVLYQLTTGQAELERAESEVAKAKSEHGARSPDADIAGDHELEVKSRVLDEAKEQIAMRIPTFQEASEHSRDLLGEMLSDPVRYQALVEDYLRGQHGPEVTSALLYLATAKVDTEAQNVYANVVLGSVDVDLERLRQSLELVNDLSGPEGPSLDLESAFDRFAPEGTAFDGPSGQLDDLDALLQER